jgi:hypothetical protein
MRGIRDRLALTTGALCAAGLSLGAVMAIGAFGAGGALASYQQDFAPFSACPYDTAGVSECVSSVVQSGEFKLGSQHVPINKRITLQGGLVTRTGELLGATLSPTALTVPGGLLGIEGLGGEVTATAVLAGPVHLDLANLGGHGPAVALPLQVKLDNPLLGGACYIGSGGEPVSLNLTTGTTSPPPPNTPISGKPGTVAITAESRILGFESDSLVDNSFAAPPVNGCGGLLALAIDPLVDLRAGLPAAAGHNAAVLNGSLSEAEARIVRTEQEIPLFGRCEKVEGVREGKTITYPGRYSAAGCFTEALESLKPGRYEWSPGPGRMGGFSGASGRVTIETSGGTRILCESGSARGDYTAAKTESIALALSGCEQTSTHQSCQSAATAGEIRTATLIGKLGFTKDGEPVKPAVGVDLAPPAGSVAQFECGGVSRTLSGSVIGALSPIDSTSAGSTLAFKQAKGHQSPEAFEGGPADTLQSTAVSGSEAAGLAGSFKISPQESIEVKARAF